jgi:hypothetical protein
MMVDLISAACPVGFQKASTGLKKSAQENSISLQALGAQASPAALCKAKQARESGGFWK